MLEKRKGKGGREGKRVKQQRRKGEFREKRRGGEGVCVYVCVWGGDEGC